MKSNVEPLDGNKVKLSVEVDAAEFDKAVDAAFRRIAREVRIPGFRPGKAPRRLLEARLGEGTARQEALRESLPDYYAKAVREHDVDVIAPPDIDITSGADDGAVAFDAVVEVRPQLRVIGYDTLHVEVPTPAVSDDEVESQVNRLREQFGELNAVSRAAHDGDHVSVDIRGYRHSETIEGLTADDFLYEVGSGTVVPELDEQLRGAKAGDILKFNATVPNQPEPRLSGEEREDEGDVTFQVLVKEVREKILPEVTDEWASEASEFETAEELRNDIRHRLTQLKKMQSTLAVQDKALDALVSLVDDDPPEALVNEDLERRVHDMQHRLEAQGADIAQYLAATGRGEQELVDELRERSVRAVKADLALRAIADSEAIEVSDDELATELESMAERLSVKPAEVRRRLDRAGQLPAVRSDLRKGKALRWLVDHVEIVDEEGRPIDRSELMPTSPPQSGSETVPSEETGD